MNRDNDAAANRYTANLYISVLEEGLQRSWQPGMKFIQNNAPIHTAKKVTK
jgi:hypothetical protein